MPFFLKRNKMPFHFDICSSFLSSSPTIKRLNLPERRFRFAACHFPQSCGLLFDQPARLLEPEARNNTKPSFPPRLTVSPPETNPPPLLAAPPPATSTAAPPSYFPPSIYPTFASPRVSRASQGGSRRRVAEPYGLAGAPPLVLNLRRAD